MSGHSKWATIKRAKALTDAKRGAVFTKLGNLITIAARDKGGDLTANFALRMAVEKAKSANMPKENIERAIKRGTGELSGGQIEELYYEGVGPANSQFIVKCLSDNKNRSASNVRHIFSKHGGSFGATMWNFEQKGVIRIDSEKLLEKKLSDDENFELELIDAGADDIQKEEAGFSVFCKVENLQKLKNIFDKKEITVASVEIEYLAKNEIKVEKEDREKIEKLLEDLEDFEDVSDYYSNINLDS